MTNLELFTQAKKTIVNPAAVIAYIKNLGLEMGVENTSQVIDRMVADYNSSDELYLKHNGHGSDFALYINMLVEG